MELAMKLLMFFVGMALCMLGIMVALSSQEHMVIGVLILFGGIVSTFGSFTPIIDKEI